jgi:hypothetical protein
MQELKVIFDLVHLGLHSVNLLGDSSCPKCPDCICPSCPIITNEVVPPAVSSALQFAQDQCLSKVQASSPAPSVDWSYSLFWLGLILGICISSVLWIFLLCLARCCRGGAAASSSSLPTSTLTPVGGIPFALSDEPANPRTLRQLGLLR